VINPATTVIPLVLLMTTPAIGDTPVTQPSDRGTHHPHAAKLRNADGSWKYTNALAGETSPYLLQHAHNPVDWHPWGEKAFAVAREQQKPIFLSVGYSTCYWCHVMERQVFEDPAIAAVMNEHFVNIKVDREERPDVDDVYMIATQLMTGQGGWPNSVFLTPPPPPADQREAGPEARSDEGPDHHPGYGLKPFWAGTYIPPTPMHGRPGFPQLAEAIDRVWREQREDVLKQAATVADAISEQGGVAGRPGEVTPDDIQRTAHALLRTYDVEHGGFGGAPKFPTPVNLLFLLGLRGQGGNESLDEPIHHTLAAMARGGMYDQVGGGFHRYSTDEKWLVPHFEKMLYDNGLLLETYAKAYEQTDDPARRRLYERVMRETAAYVFREMTDPATGAFYSAQDAEVEAREGGNYVWTSEQVLAAVKDGPLAAFAIKLYGLDGGPNFRDPHAPDAKPVNVLYLPKPLDGLGGYEKAAARRDQINALLLAVRDQRPQPATDDKVIAGWNGLMIAGLAEAGRVLGEDGYVTAARRAADAVLEHMATDDGGLYRTMRAGKAKVPAFLDDYAYFIHGLLALHAAAEADRRRYLDEARRLAAYADSRFGAEGGGWYDTLAGQTDLFVRTRGTYDGATPSGNSVMVHNLITLAGLTGDDAYLQDAAAAVRQFAQPLREMGRGMVHLSLAAARLAEADATLLKAGGEAAATQPMGPVAVAIADVARDADSGVITATVRLTIDEPYHINAHEPTEAWLIPTEVSAAGEGWAVEAAYPDAELKKFAFADEPLAVYEGGVAITVTLTPAEGAGAAPPALSVRFQPCTDEACLRPEARRLAVEP